MAKKKRIHGDVRLEVTSELPIYQNRTRGQLRYIGDVSGKEMMEFVEEDEPAKKVVETKWVKLRYDKAFKMRVTKHKETGDIRIAFRVTPQDAELLNNRRIGEYEGQLSLMLSKISFMNDGKEARR